MNHITITSLQHTCKLIEVDHKHKCEKFKGFIINTEITIKAKCIIQPDD